MGQVTLGGDPVSDYPKDDEIEVVVEEEKEPKIISQQVGDDSDCGWSQPYVLAVTKETKEEGKHVDKVQLHQDTSIEGISLRLSTSVSHEMPHGFLGSMSGGGGELADNEIQQYFDELMVEKKKAAEQAYRRFKDFAESREFGNNQNEYYFYRLVPMKNWIVVLNPYNKTKEYLMEQGFDFEAWNKEYMAIPEYEASKEWNDKVELYSELLAKGETIKKQAEMIRTSLRFKLGKTEEYGTKKRDMWPDHGLDKLDGMFKEKIGMIDTINKQLADLGEELERYRNDDVIGVGFIRTVM